MILATGNLWNGAAVNYSAVETVCRIVCMLCVGFLEEVIFRGLLFTAIAKDNIKSAILISSVTFGIGHIINLVNGSGMNLVNNLCQIVFAIAIGFLLVTIFYRGGSLLPCIFTHSAINALGTFANDAGQTLTVRRSGMLRNMMGFRITSDGNARDIHEIYEMFDSSIWRKP